MTEIERLRKSKKLQRHRCVLLALQKTGEALENYTCFILESVHTKIQQTLAGHRLPKCTNKCSKQLGKKYLSGQVFVLQQRLYYFKV